MSTQPELSVRPGPTGEAPAASVHANRGWVVGSVSAVIGATVGLGGLIAIGGAGPSVLPSIQILATILAASIAVACLTALLFLSSLPYMVEFDAVGFTAHFGVTIGGGNSFRGAWGDFCLRRFPVPGIFAIQSVSTAKSIIVGDDIADAALAFPACPWGRLTVGRPGPS